jgi:hypothetical protein
VVTAGGLVVFKVVVCAAIGGLLCTFVQGIFLL